MKLFVIKPIGGLANRMRAIEAAYHYAKANSADLVIVWEKNNILNAWFRECFEPIPGAKLIEFDFSGSSFYSRVKRKFLSFTDWVIVNLSGIRKLSDASVRANLDEHLKPQSDFFKELASAHKRVYIETCYEFFPVNASFEVSINKNIEQRAKSYLQASSDIIGVHIRRTDNFLAKEHSPLDLYIKEMNEELVLSPLSEFYISTDEEQVLSALKKEFPGKILTGASERRRDTAAGIRSALVDLYCLSRCRKILGSFYSSFSERAAKMGNIPLKIISQNNSGAG